MEILEKYRTIPITLNAANKTVTDAVISSGLECRGRILDLTIKDYDAVADLSRDDIEVVLMWHHVEKNESNLRRLSPVNAMLGRFQCFIPAAMGHLGEVRCCIAIIGEGTDELEPFLLPSLSFVIQIESEFWFGKEYDTCDDFNDIMLLIVEHRRLLNDLLEALQNDRVVFDAQIEEFKQKYAYSEAKRNEDFATKEFSRQSLFEAHEGQRDRLIAEGEARRDALAIEAEEARKSVFDSTISDINNEAVGLRHTLDQVMAFVSRVHMVYLVFGTTLSAPFQWVDMNGTTATLEHTSVDGTTLVINNPATTIELMSERVNEAESKADAAYTQVAEITGEG